MSDLPFPHALAARSAQAAAHTYDLHRGRPPRSYAVDGLACYRLPSGRVELCSDLYGPHYPRGATPGLGMVRFTQVVHPNNRAGYAVTVTQFTSASNLLQIADRKPRVGIIGRMITCYEEARDLSQIAERRAIFDECF